MAVTSGGATGAAPTPGSLPTLGSERVWELQGGSMWRLACAVLGDEPAALRAVAMGMADLSSSRRAPGELVAERLLPDAARFVYAHCEQINADGPVARTMTGPPIMEWLGRIADLQRKCLALCVFGGHTYREAADVLGLPPGTVARLLTAALLDLIRMARDHSPSP